MDRIPRFTHAPEPIIAEDCWHQTRIYDEFTDVVIEEDIECFVTLHPDQSIEGNNVTISAGTTISFLKIISIINFNPILIQTKVTFEVEGVILKDNFYFTVISYPKLTKACDF